LLSSPFSFFNDFAVEAAVCAKAQRDQKTLQRRRVQGANQSARRESGTRRLRETGDAEQKGANEKQGGKRTLSSFCCAAWCSDRLLEGGMLVVVVV